MLAGLKLQVGRLCAPDGDAVSLQARLVVPEYVLPAKKVSVVVTLPPGATAGGGCAEITIWETVTTVLPVAMP